MNFYTPGRGHVRSDNPHFYRLAAHHLMHEPCTGALFTFGGRCQRGPHPLEKQEQTIINILGIECLATI